MVVLIISKMNEEYDLSDEKGIGDFFDLLDRIEEDNENLRKRIGENMIFNNIDSAYNYLMKRLENEGLKKR